MTRDAGLSLHDLHAFLGVALYRLEIEHDVLDGDLAYSFYVRLFGFLDLADAFDIHALGSRNFLTLEKRWLRF